MYVRRFPGHSTTQPQGALPVIMLHGGAMNGSHYESTPDGRPGLAPLLSATGRTVYVADLPGTGRSHYHPDHHGPLTHWSAGLLEAIFTAPGHHGTWPDAALHTQWPGTGLRGDPTFEAFLASTVGSLLGESAHEIRVRDAGRALAERVGPCHLLTHSQSGPYGWQIADVAHHLIKTVVALEPQGPPWFDYLAEPGAALRRPYGITYAPLTYDPPLPDGTTELPYATPDGTTGSARQTQPARQLPQLRETPVLVLTAEASYHRLYDKRTAAFLQEAGVTIEHADLAECGIRGNGHLMAVEQNNTELAAFIADGIEQRD